MERADVVVVGGGAMGTATARSLGARGVDTILLERFRIGHPFGSSHGPTRIFRLSYPHPDYVRLAQRALLSWRELEAAAGEELLVTTGGMDVGPVSDDCARSLERCGVAHEWLGPDEAAERFPAVDLTDVTRILFQADAGVVRAERAIAAQARLAQASGVRVREETPVERIVPERGARGVVVHAAAGAIRARAAVVAAGSWAAPLLEAAGLPGLPLRPVLQHVGYFGAAGTDPFPVLPTLIEWTEPEIGNYSLPPVGVAPGLKVGEHAGGVEVDPRQGPFTPDPRRLEAHGEYVRRRFPTLDPTPVRPETCLYTITPDEDFVLDRAGPVVVASPCSGHGFKFAPLIGELVADLATGRTPEMPAARFGLGRPSLRQAAGAVLERPERAPT